MLFKNRVPFICNHQQMTTGCTTNIRSCNQPSLIVIDRTTSRESIPQVARPPIAWSPSQSPDQSRDLTTHDHARLIVRRCTTGRTIMYDLSATSCDSESWDLSFEHYYRLYCDQICSYDHPRLLRSITRFVSDLSAIRLILWSYIGRNMVASPVWLGL